MHINMVQYANMFFYFFSKVRLHALSTVVRIATTGCNNWVSLYQLAYSEDCLTFQNLLDVAGNIVVINMSIDRLRGMLNLLY